MQHRILKQRFALTCALALGVGASGMVTMPASAMQPDAGNQAPTKAGPIADSGTREKYIVVLEREPASLYAGGRSGLQRIPRGSNGRLELDSAAARAYVLDLENEQAAFVDRLATDIGRKPAMTASFQHAINAVVLDIDGKEALALSSVPGVKFVEPNTLLEMLTDLGPTLIQAADVWSGINTLNNLGTRGEGIVIGVLDSGINFSSPSFAEIEPIGGYVHVNPLGPGARLGTCLLGEVDDGLCNEKLIGAYDFVYAEECDPSNPLTDPCRPAGLGGTITEEPSAVDNNGHGTHTASTAGGNAVNATFDGGLVPISGVAPHANIIAYDICFTRNSDGVGLCPSIPALAAVNQAVADGVVDILNYSVSGGSQPWGDAVSLAFLGAQNAGIFVSTAAGNAGPNPGTLSHVEPWTMTVGASSHARSGFFHTVNVDAAPAVPEGPQNLRIDFGTIGPSPTLPLNAPLTLSPAYAANAAVTNDGCNTGMPAVSPYVAGQFAGQVAMIRRGTCSFAEKAFNAQNAGAVAVILANNADAVIIAGPTVGITITIPVWAMFQTAANNVRTHVLADPSPPSTIDIPSVLMPIVAVPDVMATFSSRGPSFFDLVKPDITGPGLAILAAHAGPSTSYELLQGTSMSSPHNAGAAALMRALRPSWTPAQIKSAMMLTAQSTGIFKQGGVTPSDPWDRGSGRIAVREATKAGLVMDETGDNFLAADPAASGSPSSLNLASIGHQACVGICNFTRTFRSTANGVVTWNVTVNGAIAPVTTVTPSFVVGANDTRSITVQVDSSTLSTVNYTFGEIVLTPSLGSLPTLRMPMAVRSALPEIEVSSTALDATALVDTTTTRNVSISNLGNPTLNWAFAIGDQPATLLSLPQTGNGFLAQFLDDDDEGQYLAEDFQAPAPLTISSLRGNGFVLPGGTNLVGGAGVARGATFFVYADDGGTPAGVPEVPGSPAALWTYTSIFGVQGTASPGITMTGNNIILDLAAAGAPALALQPGRYWFGMAPILGGLGNGSNAANALWAWRVTGTVSEGNGPVTTFPGAGDTAWAPINAAGLSSIVTATIPCGVPWATPDVPGAGLGIGGSNDIQVTFDATGLAPGVYNGVLCVQANDLDEPITTIALEFTVNGVQTDPSVTVGATPQTLSITEQTLIEATVTPGAFPDSTGIGVTADLSEIGGSATQVLNDTASNGDLVAGDGIYSFTATVAANTTPGNKNVPVSVIDAQLRSDSADLELTINAITAISGTGAAAPSTVARGGSTLLTVDVAEGTNPPSTGVTVSVDLSSIGSGSVVTMFDDGSNGDAVGGDGIFSRTVLVAPDTTPGAKTLTASIADNQGRADTADIEITVSTSMAPTATGLATPSSVGIGGTSLLTVTVVPGSSPASTGIAVMVNLSSIGGSANQLFFDDASNGDLIADDNVFSYSATVAAGTTLDVKSLPVSVVDAQLRSSNTDIALTIAGEQIFGDGFED